MPIDRDLLKQSELFSTMDEEVLDEFAIAGETQTYGDGDVVFAEMADSDEIYLVLEGQLTHTFALVDAGTGPDNLLVGPGEISNAVRLFAVGPNYVSCVATGDVKVVAWKSDAWRAICERHPVVGYHLVSRVAGIFYERAIRVNQMLLDNMSWGLE